MIIGLVGFKQVGKSTAASYLEEKYGFVRHNFKDALIAEIKEKFPDLLNSIQDLHEVLLQYDLSKTELFTQKPPLIRALMQNYGTEVRRGDADGYWTTKWMQGSAKLFEQGTTNIVTDDVRFVNEAETIRDFGSLLNIPYKQTIIRLTRPDMPTGGDHSSETEQLQIEADYTIECEKGDVESLYRQLDEIIKSGDNQSVKIRK